MKALLGYVIAGVCGALLVLAVQGMVNAPASGAGASDGVVDCIRARRVVVVDEEGTERAVMAVSRSGSNCAFIGVYGTSGKSGGYIACLSSGGYDDQHQRSEVQVINNGSFVAIPPIQ